MSLHALVEKWRADADFHIAVARNKKWTDWVREGHAGEARRLQSCARELESALAGGGEPVAWMDHMGGVITAAMKAADPGRPYNTPLFTHPAGSVQVTDEMTKRAEDYFYDNSPFTGPDELRGGLRGCLNAALNPGGSRE